MTHDLKVTASFSHQNVAVHITSYPYTTFYNDITTPSWKTSLNLLGRTDVPCRWGIMRAVGWNFYYMYFNYFWQYHTYNLLQRASKKDTTVHEVHFLTFFQKELVKINWYCIKNAIAHLQVVKQTWIYSYSSRKIFPLSKTQ